MISLPAFLPGSGASAPVSTIKSGVSAAMPESGVAGFAGRMPAPDSGLPASHDHRASSAGLVAADSGQPGPGSEATGAGPYRLLPEETAMPEHAFTRTAPAENLHAALPAGSVPVPGEPPVVGDMAGSVPLPEMPPVAGDAAGSMPLPERPLVAGDAAVGVPLPEMPPVTGEVASSVALPVVPPVTGEAVHHVASLPAVVGAAEARGEQIRMPVQLWRLQQQGAHPGEQALPATAMGQRQAAPVVHVQLLQRLGGAEIPTAPAVAASTDTSAVLPLMPAVARPVLATAHEWAPVSLPSTDKAMLGEQLLKTLKDKVELQLNQQVQQARIKLDPPEMGRMELTVRLEGDRLHIQINASHAGIRDAIAAQADRLRYDLLSQHGGGVEVNVGQHDRQPSSPAFNNDIEMGAELTDAGDDIRSKTAGAGWINALV